MSAIVPLPEAAIGALARPLRAALDVECVQALVERYLRPPQPVRACSPMYLRFKGDDGALVGWRIQLQDGATTHATLRLAPPERLRQEAERFTPAWSDTLALHGLRPMALLSEPVCLLLAFPVDRALIGLDALLDARSVRRLAAAHAAPLLAGAVRVSKSRSCVEVVRYKPERRAVLRWRLYLHGAESGTAERQLFVRLHAQPRAEAARLAAQTARLAGVRCVVPFSSPHRRLQLEPQLPGAELDLGAALGAAPMPAAFKERLRAAGAALARLHGARVPEGMHLWGPAQELSATAQAALVLGTLDAELGTRATALVRTLAGYAPAAPAAGAGTGALLHGDFHAGQLLFEGQDAGLVDFDRTAVGDPAYDLASFQAQLLVAGAAPAPALALAGQLQAGYRCERELPDRRTLAWFSACALTRLAVGPFRALHPNWLLRAHQLLDSAEELCATADVRPVVVGAALPGPSAASGLSELARDGALPGRELARDAALLRDRLTPLLSDVTTIGMVAHRPGRRAVMRVEGRDAAGRARTLYVKLLTPRAWRRALRVHQALPPAAGPLRLAVPSLHDEALAITITPAAAGRPLHERLLEGEPAPVDQLASLLRRLKGLPTAAGLARHTVEDERAETLRMVERVAATGLAAAGAWELLARQVERLGLPSPVTDGLLHRDLHDKQIFLDGPGLEQATLIDLEMAALGDPRVDAVNLAEHLRLRAWQHPRSPWADRLLEASNVLLQHMDLDQEEPTVRTLAALTAARLTAVYAQRPAWGDLWLRLRQRAHQLLVSVRESAVCGLAAVACLGALALPAPALRAAAGAPEYAGLRAGDGVSIALVPVPAGAPELAAGEIEVLPAARKPKLRGVLEAVDVGGRTVRLLGTMIVVPAQAQWDGGTADEFFAQARAGVSAEIKCAVVASQSSGAPVWTAEEIRTREVKTSPKLKGTVSRLSGDGVPPDTLFVENFPIVLLATTDVVDVQEDVVGQEFFALGEDEDGMARGVRRTLPGARGLTVWGSYRQSTRMERGYSLAGPALDEFGSAEPSLRAQAELQLAPRLALRTQVRALRLVVLQDTPLRAQVQPIDEQLDVEVREAYLSVGDIAGAGVGFTLGKQRIRDQREFFFDEYLDAFRLIFHRARPLVLEGSVLPSVAPLKDKFRSWDDLLLRAHLLPNAHHAATAFWLARRDQSPRRREPRYLGVTYHGEPARFVEAWALGALLRGHDKGEVLRSWAVDAAVTVRARQMRWRPSASVAFALGSGDADRGDGVNGAFRQSGHEDNSGRFDGISNFRIYGEVFQPELSNLRVWTAAAGLRPWPDVSIDLVAHAYRQDRLDAAMEDTDLLAPPVQPTGVDRDLGREVDLIVGAQRLWQRVNVAYGFGWFDPGAGFGASARVATLHRVELRVDF